MPAVLPLSGLRDILFLRVCLQLTMCFESRVEDAFISMHLRSQLTILVCLT